LSTPTPPPRRRFKWWYVFGLVLLLIAASAIGRVFLPLNVHERKLVGAWSMDADKVQMITFHASRTFVIPGLGSGRWNTDGRQLLLKLDPAVQFPTFRLQIEARLRHRLSGGYPTPITFHDENRISIHNADYTRVPAP
jgi:hypothetical protein